MQDVVLAENTSNFVSPLPLTLPGQLEHELDSKAHEADALQARLTSTESDETELRKTVGELQARLEDLEQENTGLQAQVKGDAYPCSSSSAARCGDDHWCCREFSNDC